MQGKLILVTGGAGFVGSNLIKRLVADGNRVISLDNNFAGSAETSANVDYRHGHTKDIETRPEAPNGSPPWRICARGTSVRAGRHDKWGDFSGSSTIDKER